MSRHEPADLLQGTLDMLILKVAALEPIHGYAIVQRLQQISKEALRIRQDFLYPALYRLEHCWPKGDWKTTEAGREAKFYSLTREGRRQLESETAGWKRLCEAISLVLETTESESPSSTATGNGEWRPNFGSTWISRFETTWAAA